MVYAARKVRLKRRVGKPQDVSTAESAAERGCTRTTVQVDESPFVQATERTPIHLPQVLFFTKKGPDISLFKRVDADGVAHYPFNTLKETST